jgi:hypothetical protein
MKKEIKQQVRGLRGVERVVEKKLGMNPVADADLPAPSPEPGGGPAPGGTLDPANSSRPEASAIVRDVAWAMRQTLLEKGQAPFQMGGLRVYEDLDILSQTVTYCLAKKGMCC